MNPYSLADDCEQWVFKSAMRREPACSDFPIEATPAEELHAEQARTSHAAEAFLIFMSMVAAKVNEKGKMNVLAIWRLVGCRPRPVARVARGYELDLLGSWARWSWQHIESFLGLWASPLREPRPGGGGEQGFASVFRSLYSRVY